MTGKILVAVAGEELREVLAGLLRRNNYTALSVLSHEDAFQIAKKDDSVAMVIVNLGHDRAGLRLYERFQAAEIRVKFIITTGGADDEARLAVEAAGIPLLQIPADIIDVLKVVRQQLV